MNTRARRRRGARVVRGRFGRRRPRAHDPQAFDDWLKPVATTDDYVSSTVDRDLAPIVMLGEPLWPLATAGDAGAAIALTLERLWSGELKDIRRDLILTALWGCAAAGDPASQILLNLMRQRVGKVERS